MSLKLEGGLLLQLRYLWRQQLRAASTVDVHTLRYWRPVGPASDEGIWLREAAELRPGQSQVLELDLLPRQLFGRLIYMGFCRVKLLWIHNRSQAGGILRIGPATELGWIGPWTNLSTLHMPAEGALVIACPGEGWPVTPQALALELTALEAPVVYDLAILGRLIDFDRPPGEPSSSFDSSTGGPGEGSGSSSTGDSGSWSSSSSGYEWSGSASTGWDPSSGESSYGESGSGGSSWSDPSWDDSWWS